MASAKASVSEGEGNTLVDGIIDKPLKLNLRQWVKNGVISMKLKKVKPLSENTKLSLGFECSVLLQVETSDSSSTWCTPDSKL